MAISDYSTTAASNTAISGIDITGATGKVKDGDNAIRQLMADIKAGVPYLSGTAIVMPSGTSLNPDADDGASLGTASIRWSDLFLASGSVINWDNGDATLTHAANELEIAGAVWGAPGFYTDSATINDDAVGSFGDMSPNGFGTLMVWASSGSAAMDAFMARIRTSGSPSIALVPGFGTQTNVAVTTANVTGTTGTDGKVTVSATSGSLKIENRTGAALSVGLLVFRSG